MRIWRSLLESVGVAGAILAVRMVVAPGVVMHWWSVVPVVVLVPPLWLVLTHPFEDEKPSRWALLGLRIRLGIIESLLGARKGRSNEFPARLKALAAMEEALGFTGAAARTRKRARALR